MIDPKEFFSGKKVTVMRIGLLGRGAGDAAFLAENGAEVLVVDDASQEDMQPSVDALSSYENITFKFGPYDTTDFTNTDMVLKGAGAALDSPEIAAALEKGVPVEMSASLFARLSGIPIIGVTGTRGKSTVTHMIHHVLTHTTEGAPVLLGGNVRGVSNLQLLKEVHDDSIAVMELDSWQLQGFGYAQISPHIAVFTNFMEDHLNYYQKGGLSEEKAKDQYFADKANIFLFQEENDVLITTPEVFAHAQEFAKGRNITLGQEVVLTDASVLPDDAHLSMPGEHNKKNAALAYEALKATSLPEEIIFEGLATFPGVPGRLEFLKEADPPVLPGTPREASGVRIYNDNNATTPTATLAGLKALGTEQNIILIMGGADKGLDMSRLLKEIPNYCKKVILLPGTGTEELRVKIEDVRLQEGKPVFVESLSEAVEAAMKAAESGDIILFSPAFASFGMFKNEYDRGEQFVSLVEQL